MVTHRFCHSGPDPESIFPASSINPFLHGTFFVSTPFLIRQVLSPFFGVLLKRRAEVRRAGRAVG